MSRAAYPSPDSITSVFGTCIFGLSNKKTEPNERHDKISADFEDYQDRSAEFLNLLTVLSDTPKSTCSRCYMSPGDCAMS